MSNKKNNEIYADNAAATQVDSRVLKEMLRGTAFFGNPSAYNDSGRAAAGELARARLNIAGFLGAHSDEIVFTSSGSEANSLAIQGIFSSGSVSPKNEIITTPIEHPSVLNNIKVLYPKVVVRYVPVDSRGLVSPEAVLKLITSKTRLVSIMYANNEIGTIEPIAEIGKLIKEYKKKLEIRNLKLGIDGIKYPLFHVDACQVAGYLDMNVRQLGVDLLTMNGAKIYGPKGIGLLFVRQGVNIRPLILGGGQEYGRRAGTENLPAIMGLAEAIRLIKPDEGKKIAELRDYLLRGLKEKIPDIKINGPLGEDRLANNINISIPKLSAEFVLLELDRMGVRAGSGSACTARAVEPSHVLKAIGTEGKYINGAIRFSLGRTTTKTDVDYILKVLPDIIRRLKKRFAVI